MSKLALLQRKCSSITSLYLAAFFLFFCSSTYTSFSDMIQALSYHRDSGMFINEVAILGFWRNLTEMHDWSGNWDSCHTLSAPHQRATHSQYLFSLIDGPIRSGYTRLFFLWGGMFYMQGNRCMKACACTHLQVHHVLMWVSVQLEGAHT